MGRILMVRLVHPHLWVHWKRLVHFADDYAVIPRYDPAYPDDLVGDHCRWDLIEELATLQPPQKFDVRSGDVVDYLY